jgi:hypothetical protein
MIRGFGWANLPYSLRREAISGCALPALSLAAEAETCDAGFVRVADVEQ